MKAEAVFLGALQNSRRGGSAATVPFTGGSRVGALSGKLRAGGIASLHGLAKALTARGIPTARGGAQWSAMQVGRVLARL